jgi:beta-glucanase (GH16 family)
VKTKWLYVVSSVVSLSIVGVIVFVMSTSKADGSTSDTSSVQPPDVSNSSAWSEVFSDNFSGNTLNTNKWVTCYDWRPASVDGCTNSGNNEQEWYLPQQVSVQNGSAVLTATDQPVTVDTSNGPQTYPYRSGMISTGRPDSTGNVKWSATYGYFIARMKIDGGQGVWPAFWLLPTNTEWPPEIDIMEHLGSEPNNVLLTTHWPSSNGPQKDSTTITGPNYTQGWHTYAVNWQPGSIDWYIDGTLKKTFTGPEVPNTPMEMIINLAIGGGLPGSANATTPFPRTVQVDYVHVYERKP